MVVISLIEEQHLYFHWTLIIKIMEYKSDQELQFSWWLDDLVKREVVVKYYYEPSTFTLSTAKKCPYIKKMVTKTKIESLSLLDAHVYTPDFLVEWNSKYDGVFYREIMVQKYSTKPPFFAVRSKKNNKLYTFFEVKADFDYNNMTRAFKINQKWLYDKHDVYVDLAILPEKLFKKTFVPQRYLFTDKTKAPRTIKFAIRLVDDYLALLKRDEFTQIQLL